MTATRLAPEQQDWVDQHIGEPTAIRVEGTITAVDVKTLADDGLVLFTVQGVDGTMGTFVARPPLTEAQIAEQEAARQAADDKAEAERAAAALEADAAAAEEAEAAAAAEEARLVELVDKRLRHAGITVPAAPATTPTPTPPPAEPATAAPATAEPAAKTTPAATPKSPGR